LVCTTLIVHQWEILSEVQGFHLGSHSTQFANDKTKLESAENNKHFDVQEKKETFSEQKTDKLENTAVRSAIKLQYDCA